MVVYSSHLGAYLYGKHITSRMDTSKTIALGMLLILMTHCRAQIFTAGEHGIADYYVDVDPDTIMELNGPNSQVIEYPIDLNADDVPDLNCVNKTVHIGLGHHESNMWIVPSAGVELARVGIDSCFTEPPMVQFVRAYPMAHMLNEGDSMQSLSYSDDSVYFAYSYSTPQSQCFSYDADSVDDYVGLRIWLDGVAYHGWVRLRRTYWGFFVKSHALSSMPVGGAEYGQSSDKMRAAVVPGGVRLSFDNGSEEVIEAGLFDTAGKLVGSSHERLMDGSFMLSTIGLGPGLYLISVDQGAFRHSARVALVE
jgi:hypothetical protein